MQDDASTTTTTDTTPQVDSDSMIYLMHRLTKPLLEAAIVGQRHGLLTRADLPLEMPDGPAFLAAFHKVLDERGALAARRAELQMNAKVAVCPWWCWGQHDALYDMLDGVAHEQQVVTITYDENEPRRGQVTINISAWENSDGEVAEPTIYAYSVPEELSASGARVLIEHLAKAADRLDEITAATA
jgi:hypothetical protein